MDKEKILQLIPEIYRNAVEINENGDIVYTPPLLGIHVRVTLHVMKQIAIATNSPVYADLTGDNIKIEGWYDLDEVVNNLNDHWESNEPLLL